MSAIPIRQEIPSQGKATFLEVYNAALTLDPFQDRLKSQGYQILEAKGYEDGLELARQYLPAIILIYDDPATDVDALHWLELQHYDRVGRLAMIPLLILAEASRVPDLKIEELPDRVIVLQRRADTLNQLTRAVKRLLRVWEIE